MQILGSDSSSWQADERSTTRGKEVLNGGQVKVEEAVKQTVCPTMKKSTSARGN